MIIHNNHPPDVYTSLLTTNYLILQFKHMITNMQINVSIQLFTAPEGCPDSDLDSRLLGSPTPLISEVAYLKSPLDYILVKRSSLASIQVPMANDWIHVNGNWYMYNNISQLLPCSWRTDMSLIMLCDATIEAVLAISDH